MDKDLKKYVFKFENFLSKEFCNKTIDQLKKAGKELLMTMLNDEKVDDCTKMKIIRTLIL